MRIDSYSKIPFSPHSFEINSHTKTILEVRSRRSCLRQLFARSLMMMAFRNVMCVLLTRYTSSLLLSIFLRALCTLLNIPLKRPRPSSATQAFICPISDIRAIIKPLLLQVLKLGAYNLTFKSRSLFGSKCIYCIFAYEEYDPYCCASGSIFRMQISTDCQII